MTPKPFFAALLLILLTFFFVCPVPGQAQELQTSQTGAAVPNSAAMPKAVEGWLPLRDPKLTADLHDHKALIFELEGKVRMLKQGEDQWIAAEKGMTLEEGDQIVTEAGSWIKIAYDGHFLNVAMIKEKTKAEFRTIEPTDLHMEDGSVFSAVDGLDGAGYQISTPTAVAAVRGTHFEIQYESATGKLDAVIYPDGGELSHIFLTDVNAENVSNDQKSQESAPPVDLKEGQELTAGDGALLKPELVTAMSPERMEAYRENLGNFFKGELAEKRGEWVTTFHEGSAPMPEPPKTETTFDPKTMDAQMDRMMDKSFAIPAPIPGGTAAGQDGTIYQERQKGDETRPPDGKDSDNKAPYGGPPDGGGSGGSFQDPNSTTFNPPPTFEGGAVIPGETGGIRPPPIISGDSTFTAPPPSDIIYGAPPPPTGTMTTTTTDPCSMPGAPSPPC